MMNREVWERWSRMLQDPDSKVQMRALTEVGRAYFRPTSEPTLEGVTLGGTGAINTASHAKGELLMSLQDAILKKLNADDSTMRAEAVLALVHWQDEETTNALLKSLKDPDSTVRLAAVQTLATMGRPRFIAPLLEVAESDAEELVRAHALAAIEGLLQVKAEEGERKSLAAARRTKGVVRDRGVATEQGLLKALAKITKTDPSPYVAFLAERARKRLSD